MEKQVKLAQTISEKLAKLSNGPEFVKTGTIALMANIALETGGTYDPKQKQSNGGPAIGLFQMEGPMRKDYLMFLKKQGLADSADAQVAYVVDQLDHGSHIGPGNARKICESFASGDYLAATETFCKLFERPSEVHLPERLQHAENWEKTFQKEMQQASGHSGKDSKRDSSPTRAADAGPPDKATSAPHPRSETEAKASLGATWDGEVPAATYEVKPRDNLSKIAQAHGVGLRKLLEANPDVKDPNKIVPGQQLNLPAPSTRGQAQAAEPNPTSAANNTGSNSTLSHILPADSNPRTSLSSGGGGSTLSHILRADFNPRTSLSSGGGGSTLSQTLRADLNPGTSFSIGDGGRTMFGVDSIPRQSFDGFGRFGGNSGFGFRFGFS